VRDADLLARVFETLEGYCELGSEVREAPLARPFCVTHRGRKLLSS